MLQPHPFPQWIIDSMPTMIEGYIASIPLLEARCQHIAYGDHFDADGMPCDGTGTLTEYRLDAKYCAGALGRLLVVYRDMVPLNAWKDTPFANMPTNPRQIAPWAWDNPWKDRIKGATELIGDMQWSEFYLRFTERERRALVYTIGCKMTHQQAAAKMGITVKTLRNTLLQSRKRFGPNVLPFQKQERRQT